MPLARLLLVAGLLAISVVDAKHKLSVDTWDNSQCDGHPTGGKHLSELKEDKCTLLDGSSIMVRMHKKKYSKWINDFEKSPCHVTVYNKPGCLDDAPPTEQKVIPVPADFRKCIDVSAHAASVKFSCKPLPEWDHSAFNTTTVVPRTSYSIDYEGYAHPHTSPVTLTTSAVSLGEAHMAARAEATANATLEERGDHNIRRWWAKHPWTGSDICYKCWTDHKTSWDNFGCKSGRGIGFHCDPAPPLEPIRVVAPVHVTATVTSTLHVMLPHVSTEYIPITSTILTEVAITTIVPIIKTTYYPTIPTHDVSYSPIPVPPSPIYTQISTILVPTPLVIPTMTHTPVLQAVLTSIPTPMTISTVVTVPTLMTLEHVIMSESPMIVPVTVMTSKPFTTSTVAMVQKPVTVATVVTGLKEVTISSVVMVPISTTVASVVWGHKTVTNYPFATDYPFIPTPSSTTITATITVPAERERDAAVITSAPGLEERKDPKLNVVFINPYTGDKVCARAEWEDEHNRNKDEVRIKHPKKFEKCHDKDAVYIDRVGPAVTVSTVITHIVTQTVVATPTPIYITPLA